MNKRLSLAVTGAVLLAASVTTFMCVDKSDDPMDDLFRANVEALTQFEESKTSLCYRYDPFGVQKFGIYCNSETRPPQIYPCTEPYSDRMSGTSQCYR